MRSEVYRRWRVEKKKILLASIVADPSQPVSQLSLLTPLEWGQLLDRWNQTHADYQMEWDIPQRFEAQVEQTPEAAAVFRSKGVTPG